MFVDKMSSWVVAGFSDRTSEAQLTTGFSRPRGARRLSRNVRRKGLLAMVVERCQIKSVATRITYWKEADGRYLGYLNDYPDHWTQGDTLADLKDHLRDLFQTFSKEEIPGIRKEEELELA